MDENVWKQTGAKLICELSRVSPISSLIADHFETGVPTMKNSALYFVTILTLGPTMIATAEAGERTIPSTGTAFEIARQYADGGPHSGPSTGHTGTALDVARDSLRFLGSPDQIAGNWRMPPIVARGE